MSILRDERRSACSSLQVVFFPPSTPFGPRFQRSRGDLTAYLRGTGARWRVYGSHAGVWRLGVVAGGVVRSKAGGCTAPGGYGTRVAEVFWAIWAS
ncbi:hypothetical protein E1A91_A05G392100v1 [Gossypium mustelinum]|uniref:Uncharacterized protein n=1 Tax=Gossypium mustelinum TaxID=34275 RepID=A0A5D2ZGD3_GOSMU|nr:hypothetical protein E1A91_A05G392100v1 [Gossypium mustelinum]